MTTNYLDTTEAHEKLDNLIAMLERTQIVLRSVDRKLDLAAGAPETSEEYNTRRDREAIDNEREVIEGYRKMRDAYREAVNAYRSSERWLIGVGLASLAVLLAVGIVTVVTS